jgi:Ca2+-binding EF-hand superfamily protein
LSFAGSVILKRLVNWIASLLEGAVAFTSLTLFFVELLPQVGTPYTCAPEIIKGTYDERCDVWSVGVIAYLLLSGETPFGGLDGENLVLVKENILRAKVLFDEKQHVVWSVVSAEAKQFVKKLLHPTPSLRPTAHQAQKEDWIQVYAKKDVNVGERLNPTIVGALMKFKECTDMQKLLSEVLSFTLLPEQIVELRAEFEKIDVDGSGEISLSAMKAVLVENAESGSLGSLTETEIEDIFDAMRIRKNEPTIRWHEFLAAGLSQARVDDRNLQLAFDRLDTDRKGYISFVDMQTLLGGTICSQGFSLETLWKQSLKECQQEHHNDRIDYEDFKHLMKGQPGAAARRRSSVGTTNVLKPVHEGKEDDDPFEAALSADRLCDISNEPPRPILGRPRSQSMSQKNPEYCSWNDSISDLFPKAPRRSSLAVSIAIRPDADVAGSPLTANRALYRKHRELRLAVLDASKQFDKSRNDRRNQGSLVLAAGLTMKRGVVITTPALIEMEDRRQRELVELAARRCGRRGFTGPPNSPRTRTKTKSDVSGLLMVRSQQSLAKDT